MEYQVLDGPTRTKVFYALENKVDGGDLFELNFKLDLVEAVHASNRPVDIDSVKVLKKNKVEIGGTTYITGFKWIPCKITYDLVVRTGVFETDFDYSNDTAV